MKMTQRRYEEVGPDIWVPATRFSLAPFPGPSAPKRPVTMHIGLATAMSIMQSVRREPGIVISFMKGEGDSGSVTMIKIRGQLRDREKEVSIRFYRPKRGKSAQLKFDILLEYIESSFTDDLSAYWFDPAPSRYTRHAAKVFRARFPRPITS